MGIVLAIIFMGVAVVAAVAYGGTPHGGPTTSCGPIMLFGNSYTIDADCRYVSIGEIVVAIVFFLTSVMAALSARPNKQP